MRCADARLGRQVNRSAMLLNCAVVGALAMLQVACATMESKPEAHLASGLRTSRVRPVTPPRRRQSPPVISRPTPAPASPASNTESAVGPQAAPNILSQPRRHAEEVGSTIAEGQASTETSLGVAGALIASPAYRSSEIQGQELQGPQPPTTNSLHGNGPANASEAPTSDSAPRHSPLGTPRHVEPDRSNSRLPPPAASGVSHVRTDGVVGCRQADTLKGNYQPRSQNPASDLSWRNRLRALGCRQVPAVLDLEIVRREGDFLLMKIAGDRSSTFSLFFWADDIVGSN